MLAQKIDPNIFITSQPSLKSQDFSDCEPSPNTSPSNSTKVIEVPSQNVNKQKSTKSSSKSFKNRKKSQDFEYHKKERVDMDFNLKNQKKNRNVLSNLVHHLFKYLITSQRLNRVIDRIITKENLDITMQ